MVARVMQSVVLIVLTTSMLTGCGRQAAQESSWDPSLLATGPDRTALPAARPFVAAALDATGGLTAWEACRKIEFHAAVTACERDGCFYLTEHDFVLYPWSDAIQVKADEPQADFTWYVLGEQRVAPQADPNRDVSPLRDVYCDYAEAVLQVVTAPVRMLQDGAVLTPAAATTQIAGRWYLAIDAKHQARKIESQGKGAVEPYWTQGIYFQSQDGSVVDMVWLGNPDTQKFVLVRGYDYGRSAGNDVLIPTKIEVFQSDPYGNIGSRLALMDLTR